jgi:hypothetical protein
MLLQQNCINILNAFDHGVGVSGWNKGVVQNL